MTRSSHYDLQSLRVFIVVAELGSLTKAAERTCLTLSAVSKRMTDLERSIDCVLMLRLPRGIELTAAGKGLLAHARQVVDRVNRMANEMSDYAAGVRGHVRVWANTSAIIQFLPHDVQAFLADNPSVKISLEERFSDAIVAAIRSGDADIGIFADNVLAPDIDKAAYRQDKLVLLVPKGHPLASRKEVAFADTLDFEYVGLTEGSSLLARLLDAAFNADRALKLRIQVSSFDGICRMIEHGLGIGILPEGAVRSDILAAGLRAVKLTDSWASRTLRIGTLSRERLSPDALRLFDFMSGRTDS
ncbi:LysR family transcriptional regulator [Paraburkholderia sp. BL23I1N1]|uniref:LysR family transcriptional regulator n=1 Tax=Paraburkholderia sp. BL23I1N1 TaxID=1938802 RepID=UPI000E770657|nr:LysR family transcriptional regulator [Paraburkholderia sp. BL23I1N1]RKE37844.1 LysR family transcriptional regulator [Paraburkholderia sp. BL23I1N1]